MGDIVDLQRLNGIECEEAYLWRIGQAKDSGELDMDWESITKIINCLFREDESKYVGESVYRKDYSKVKKFVNAGVFVPKSNSEDNYLKELRLQEQVIQKEKQKLFDERIGLKKLLREQSRREELFEIVKRAIDEYEPIVFDYAPVPIVDGDADMIIHITDIHCGVNIKSPFNTFSFEILQKRIKKFLDEIFEIQKMHHAQNAYVVLGGDLVQGLIHTNGRIEAKENIVEQIKKVSDVLGHFIDELRYSFENVYVFITPGNHSRSTASKEESVKGENFDLLVHYVLRKDFKNVENVHVIDNELDVNIATFDIRGWRVYASHGDKESEKTVVYNMTKLARKANYPLPDICLLGHYHSNGVTTVDGAKVISTGCLDGMDTYAIDNRYVGAPEQSVTVVTKNKRIKGWYDIQLN